MDYLGVDLGATNESSDAKDFYDNPTVKRKAFDFDWGIAVNKHGIAKKLEREVKSMDKDEAANSTLKDLAESDVPPL